MNNNKIPTGFKKMELELTFTKKQIPLWENVILKTIIRDYYIYYSKKQKFPESEKDNDLFWQLNFYCRPKDEIIITYHLGAYAQATFTWYSKKGLIKNSHVLPRNFPECILLNLPEEIEEKK